MEIEFKFCIPPERLAAVQAALRRGRCTAIRMEARYFDTPDGALASRGIAFRLRREGDQWVQTVKALGDGPLDRQEHNVARGTATEGTAPEPQPQLHSGTVAGARLQQALQAAGSPLVETYGTEMDRLTRDITRQGTVVELALDTGRVVAHRGTAQQAEAPICELELELKAGPVTGLAAFAAQWATRHGLYLSTVSKAERGERLLAAPDHSSPRKTRPPSPQYQQLPAGLALQRAVVAQCLQQILGPASDLAEGSNDEEQLHQLRIGIRRLRTALRELAPLAPGHLDPAWEPPLVHVFQQLGHLRDRSQVMQRIGAELRACIAAHGADDGIGMERLVAALGAVKEDGVAVPVLAQGVDGAAGAHLHPQPGHVALQQGEDVRRLIGIRVDPSGFVGAGVKPQRPEPFQRRGGVHGVQQRGQRLWVCGEITLRRDASVAEVAPAVAGGQQLFAAAGVAVQHGDAHCPGGGRLCCGQRRRHPGRTAA